MGEVSWEEGGLGGWEGGWVVYLVRVKVGVALIWMRAGAGEARVPSVREEKRKRLWSFIFLNIATRVYGERRN